MDYKVYQEKLYAALKIGRQAVVVDDMPPTVERLTEDEVHEVWQWAEARRVAAELGYQLMNAYWPRTSGPQGMLEVAAHLVDHPEDAAGFYREMCAACWDSGMAENLWDVIGAAAENWLGEREQ